jgi:hypothetical protein
MAILITATREGGKANYQAEFSEDPTCTNLDNWRLYEQKNPSTFSNMYQFWCTRSA